MILKHNLKLYLFTKTKNFNKYLLLSVITRSMTSHPLRKLQNI